LTLATSSVKSHIQHLYGKMGVNSKREAVRRARELGLLEPGSSLPAAELRPVKPSSPKPVLPVQVTRFFGREDDIAQVRDRLDEWRLVTLTGPGGVGKTRLSLQVAEDGQDDFPDGVYFVELAYPVRRRFPGCARSRLEHTDRPQAI
jgi:hypothetical protein